MVFLTRLGNESHIRYNGILRKPVDLVQLLPPLDLQLLLMLLLPLHFALLLGLDEHFVGGDLPLVHLAQLALVQLLEVELLLVGGLQACC